MKNSALDFDLSPYVFRRIYPYDASDIVALNKLLQSSIQFFLFHTGAPARPDEAQRMFAEIPSGKTEQAKYVMALFDGSEMIGCADILREFPQKKTAVIKLLLLAESCQDQGLGGALLSQITELVGTWGCNEMHLGVCTGNKRGFKFWRRKGFVEIRREALAGDKGEAVILRKNLISETADCPALSLLDAA
jgi:GNAT superfamily N-acetyltransferase